uniref:Uncharacterized protein n=1 Tax=Caenorhabditis tropicalis TaxID=1561998 RepID=A0A1I7UWG0_9PELO
MEYDKVHKAEEKLAEMAKEFTDRNPEELLAARGAPSMVDKPFPPTTKVIQGAEVKETSDGKEEMKFCMFSSKKQE